MFATLVPSQLLEVLEEVATREVTRMILDGWTGSLFLVWVALSLLHSSLVLFLAILRPPLLRLLFFLLFLDLYAIWDRGSLQLCILGF